MTRWLVVLLAVVTFTAIDVRYAEAQVGTFKRLVDVVDARTIASNGSGTAATLTLTPNGSYVALTCNDTDGCAITLGETGQQNGMHLMIVNVSANACTFSDTSGVSELTGSASLGQWGAIYLEYVTDRWVEIARNAGSGGITTTGSPASGNLAFFSGASSITSGNLSGDGTTSGTGALTIANDAVSNAKLRNSGALSVIGRSANSSGDPADISASAASDAVLRESGSTLGFGTIATAGIAADAVTFAKIQNASGASVLVGRGSASGAGDFQEITLGSGLSMSGTVLSSTGGGGGSSSGAILAFVSYNPGSAADTTTTSATPADVDSTNLTITFTAPTSGSVAVELSAVNLLSSGSTGCGWNLRTTGGADISGTWMQVNASAAQQTRPFYRVVITGLTPSASVTYRWGHYVTATAATCNTRYGGGDVATARGAATMMVFALP